MIVTNRTRKRLAVLRERRALLKDGWEEVDLNGGKLWELDRGGRSGKKIVQAKPSISGKALWVKIA